MEQIAGIPYRQLQFTKKGAIFKHEELAAVRSMITDEAITDLFVISHGWNNDIVDAESLYTKLGTSISGQLTSHPRAGLENSEIAFVGVLWPAKKFTDPDRIAGGGAGIGDEAAEMKAELEDFFAGEDADDDLAEAMRLIDRMEDDENAAAAFVDVLRRQFAAGDDSDDEAADRDFLTRPAEEIVATLSAATDADAGFDTDGGAAGFGDGIANLFGNVRDGARKALNTATYYLMKKRAGLVGANGLNQVLKTLRDDHQDLRLHMVGHSFGARLVTAAVNGPQGDSDLHVDSVSLLQAAFSHNAFAEDFRGDRDGFFRPVAAETRVNGPIIVTHTKNDKAVKLPYAAASRLAGQDAAGVGDADDRFGALGSNGAQSTPEVHNSEAVLKRPDSSYAFIAGKVHNLLADDFISGHSDITSPAVANAVVEAARKR